MTLQSSNLLQKITNLKLDIIDHTKKKLHIFELTVLLATNMEQMSIDKKHKNTYNSSQTSQDTTAQ